MCRREGCRASCICAGGWRFGGAAGLQWHQAGLARRQCQQQVLPAGGHDLLSVQMLSTQWLAPDQHLLCFCAVHCVNSQASSVCGVFLCDVQRQVPRDMVNCTPAINGSPTGCSIDSLLSLASVWVKIVPVIASPMSDPQLTWTQLESTSSAMQLAYVLSFAS